MVRLKLNEGGFPKVFDQGRGAFSEHLLCTLVAGTTYQLQSQAECRDRSGTHIQCSKNILGLGCETVLCGSQRANDCFLLLLVPSLKPQVLFYSGKFISCGFVVKKKMTLSLNGPLVGPWADRPPTVVCLAKKPPGASATVTSFPKK